MIRFVLCPGVLKKGHSLQYMSASTVANAYGVDMSECVVDTPSSLWKRGWTQSDLNSLIWLFPQADGNYILPQPGVRRRAPVSANEP